MSDFPSLTPETRTYTPGAFAVYRTTALSGDQIAVRRNNAATNYLLSLTFVSSTAAFQETIFNHYAVHHRFQPFDLPSAITDGGGFSFPANYQWIYGGPPEVTFTSGRVEVSVQLELVAPYDI
tara:strand:+ start:5057 stop:5425 length:369 start_codon:yes stop_codon:yes gene_type:complete